MLLTFTAHSLAVPINELFFADFENPVVVGYDEQPPYPAGWVAANQGFGASRHGLCNEDGGNFTAPGSNAQVMAFRYTNSGTTTEEEVIGPLIGDATYTFTFDAVADVVGSSTGTAYTAQLFAMPLGNPRNDCRGNPTGSTLLGSATGNVPGDGTWVSNITVTFYADPVTYASILGQDIVVRFKGQSTCASVDNVRVMDDIPPAGTVITLY